MGGSADKVFIKKVLIINHLKFVQSTKNEGDIDVNYVTDSVYWCQYQCQQGDGPLLEARGLPSSVKE